MTSRQPLTMKERGKKKEAIKQTTQYKTEAMSRIREMIEEKMEKKYGKGSNIH